MTFPSPRLPQLPLRGFARAATALLAALAALPAQADDRDVLRDSAARPYVFFVLDNSGTMNLRPPCNDAEIADGKCLAEDRCLPDEGCRVPLEGDDPNSKFHIAREALYEVIQQVGDVDFGFATMNQDHLRVKNKHWLYQVRNTAPPLTIGVGGPTYPVDGTNETFGALLPVAVCSGSGDQGLGCTAANPINIAANTWNAERFRRLPKLGADGLTTTDYFHVDPAGGTPLRVRFAGTAALGDSNLNVDVTVSKCSDAACTTVGAPIGSSVARYELIGEYLIHDPTVDRTGTPTEVGWLGYTDAEADADGGCSWEGNTDGTADTFESYFLTWPHLEPLDPYDPFVDTIDNPADPPVPATIPGDRYQSDPTWPVSYAFSSGDQIPLEWVNTLNHDLILEHLSSKRFLTSSNGPDDFGLAPYFNDQRISPANQLEYEVPSQRTLIPLNVADLSWGLKSYRGWYRGCTQGSCPSDIGWDDMAARLDTRWACRRRFMVVVTDGMLDDDMSLRCPGDNRNACSITASMAALDDTDTFVVALGRETGDPHNPLNCMAANGNTGDPIFPLNKDALVEALLEIIGRVREQAAAFASAAVPQVQANATDKIFLSSFTPINETGFWAGRLDAFLKPLPLTDQGQPDRSTPCSPTRQSQCFLWDAGDVQMGHTGDAGYVPGRLLLQAPDPSELPTTPPWDATQLMLGTDVDERRVVYTKYDEPGNRRMFSYPSTDAEKYDLWDGLGLSYIVGDVDSVAAANDTANTTIATTLVEKQEVVRTPDPTDPSVILETPISYLMGDIFHADPIVHGRPTSFGYYTNDPYLNKPLCGAAADPDRTPPPSYRWFADRNFCRRSILMTAANDGQLHVFDGGTFGQVGSTPAECLLPAKDLDGDGTSETNEFNLSTGDDDYDLDDEVSGFMSCTSDSDCGGIGTCSGGFCSNVKIGVVDGGFDNGSGREIFSFIPRGMLQLVHKLAQPGTDRNRGETWGMDGSPRVDDVFIDPLATEGSVTCLNRQWRTVAIGGYREGGTGYYALDITQPDTLDADHVPEPAGTPAYVPSCFDGTNSGCSRPYPSVLWEFQDTDSVTVAGAPMLVSLDEDLNGVADLSRSWGRVSTGRLRVCTGGCTANETEDRFVAVFGGGVAYGDTPGNDAGNFLYMIDIETGKTIYKKPVIGAVAGDVAAIDYNGDGYIDRLYAGTIAGLVYKVQLEGSSATPHRLTSQTVQTQVAGTNVAYPVLRLEGPTGDTAKYDPFQVFSTGDKPIYQEISAVFVAEKNRIAMAFGTGNRSNLWDRSGREGRFYVILDDNWADPDRDGVLNVSCGGCTQPLTEASYTALDPDAAFDPTSPVYYLYNGGASGTLPGWYFTLDPNEKVITEGFSLAGVTLFTSFVPTEVANSDGTCSRAGTSRIFIVGTVTALGYSIPPGGTIADRGRYTEIQQFTTPPFVERSATANPESGGGNTQHADYITESLGIIRDELKKLQSNRCRYASYTQNIKTIRSDTGVVFVAPIPLCIDPVSWKEF